MRARHIIFCFSLSLVFSLSSVRAQSITLTAVATSLDKPLYVTHAPNDDKRLFIVEKDGLIRILADGKVDPTPFLDIRDRTSRGSEQGLLGLAFHPGFRENGRFVVNYTDLKGDTVIAELLASPPSAPRVDGGTARTLLKIEQPYANHNGGCLQFGPDGMLYIGLGDGGSGGDPEGNAQNLGTLLGKMLRIELGEPGSYVSPRDNPFAGRSGARPEIWAYGLRNPWRFSFDSLSGRLFVADVGQNTTEEVNIVERGKNYGWNLMEGSKCFVEGCDPSGFERPITEYGRSEGVSVTGGYFYRGRSVLRLVGRYVFADFGSGTIWTLTEESPGFWKREVLFRKPMAISSFGEDAKGELYVVDFAGSIYRFDGTVPRER